MKISRSDITLQRLEDALERLLAQKPERTKADGKISPKRINDEAGLSAGSIYYYKEFLEKARAEIEVFKQNKKKEDILDQIEVSVSKEKRLRDDRNKEKFLKDKYRKERDNFKKLTDEIVIENVSLAHRVMELEIDINRNSSGKVVNIGDWKDESE